MRALPSIRIASAAVLTLGLAAAPAPPTAAAAVDAPDLAVAVEPAEATVGDPIAVILTLEVPAGDLAATPRFPAWGDSWGEAELVEIGEPEQRAEGGHTGYRQRVVVRAFRPGRIPLPPVAVAVPLVEHTVELATPADLTLGIRSVLPADAQTADLAPRPPRPPHPLPWGRAFWISAAALAVACLGAALLLTRRAAPVPARHEDEPDPLAELARALERLAGEPDAERLHTGLSLAVRRYLARRLGFPALESTTAEIARRLRAGGPPGLPARGAIELLRACDQVKFARVRPGAARGERRRAEAGELARAVEEALAPAVPAGGGAEVAT